MPVSRRTASVGGSSTSPRSIATQGKANHPPFRRLLLLSPHESTSNEVCEHCESVGVSVDIHLAQTRTQLLATLHTGQWDAVLAEIDRPAFDALLILADSVSYPAHLPLIVLADQIDEDVVLRIQRFSSRSLIPRCRLDLLPDQLKTEIMRARMLCEQKDIERQLRFHAHDLTERIKELNCLYGISRTVERWRGSLENVLAGIVKLLPPAWQYPSITCARIRYGERNFQTDPFEETSWRQVADILVNGVAEGQVEVFYMDARQVADEGPFLREERDLLDAVAARVGHIIERILADEALREKHRLLCASERALKMFCARLLAIREDEKKRITNTLHDELGSITVGMTSALSIIERHLRDGNVSSAFESIQSMRVSLLESVESLKRLVYDLRPPNLEILGLPGAIQELVDGMRCRTSLRVTLQQAVGNVSIEENAAIALYRVAQEALNNVYEHAEATNVAMRLYLQENHIHLEIADDGLGFDPKAVAPGPNIGIPGMKERIHYLDGTFSLESAPGLGTTVHASIFLG